jgi:hypothetical protein
VLATFQGSGRIIGVRLGPNEAPVALEDVDESCLTPATTSSDVDAARRRVSVSNAGEVRIQGEPEAAVFGCQ